ncbi:2-haloacrylate reductase [bacterium HR29]|nr:2-haloacrylate reductase [bacterium HR29]
MRAVVIARPGGPEVLEVREVADPVPGPDDLLVRVRAAGVNRADILQRMGGYPQPGPRGPHEIPGLEFAGEVLEAGWRVEGFRPGDRVMGLLAGEGYAELVSVNARHCVLVPPSLSWEEAGGTPETAITALDALLQCGLAPGERVLIHAVGSGVGTHALQIAKMMGASLVLGTAGSDEKLARARELGLDVGINYRTESFPDVVREATEGRGVDVILDVVGASYLDENLRSLSPKGRMIVVGLLGGSKAELDLGMLLRGRLQVRGTTLRARPLEEKAAAVRAFERMVLPHLASGRIRTVVDRVFPLEQVADAHRYMEANANFGKIVLRL